MYVPSSDARSTCDDNGVPAGMEKSTMKLYRGQYDTHLTCVFLEFRIRMVIKSLFGAQGAQIKRTCKESEEGKGII